MLLPVMTLLALAIGISACSATDSDAIDQLRADTARATEAAQRAQVLAALEPLNPLRYHQLDRMIREDQHIAADAVIWATRAREALSWVDWPHELEGHVEQYADWLDALLATFRDDDALAAEEPSKITHALAHTFEATLEAWLSNESLPAVPALAGLEPPMHGDTNSDNGQHNDHDE